MKRTRFSAVLHDIAPPVVWRLLRRGDKPVAARATYDGEFATYEAAVAAAPVQSYDDDVLVETILQKTAAYRTLLGSGAIDATPPVMRVAGSLALAGSQGELRVLDFGGAFGTHYWIARALLPKTTKLRWHVVETPGHVQRAAALATDELRFFDDLDAASRALGTADLVYCDGVLQALPDPLATLDRLLRVPARCLCVHRVATADRPLVTINRIPLSVHEPEVPLPSGVEDVVRSLPMTFQTVATYEAALSARANIRLRFGLHDGPVHRGTFTVHMRGYGCELTTRP